MHGGAQSHLIRCADGGYYVAKFQNHREGARIRANELLETKLAPRLGLPTRAAAVVEVRENPIERTDDLVIRLGRGRTRCRVEWSFPNAPLRGLCTRHHVNESARENPRHQFIARLLEEQRISIVPLQDVSRTRPEVGGRANPFV
jgi:hypothetical protein